MQTRSSQNGSIRVFLFAMTVGHITEEMIIIIRGSERDSLCVQLIREVDFIQKSVLYFKSHMEKINAAY